MSAIDIEYEKSLLRDRILGRAAATQAIDPGVSLAKDLVFERTENGRDLAMVKGIDTLNQALEIALTTRLSDDLFNTGFGFDGLNALAEETNPVLSRERIRIAIIKLLQAEPRVRKIIDVKMPDGQLERQDSNNLGANSSESASVLEQHKRLLHVSVAFETVSGDTTTFSLGAIGSHG